MDAMAITNPRTKKPDGLATSTPQPAATSILGQTKQAVGKFGASQDRVRTLQGQQQRLPIPAPVIIERRGGWSAPRSPATDAAVLANQTIGRRINEERTQQSALGTTLSGLTPQLRQQTEAQRARRAGSDTSAGARLVLGRRFGDPRFPGDTGCVRQADRQHRQKVAAAMSAQRKTASGRHARGGRYRIALETPGNRSTRLLPRHPRAHQDLHLCGRGARAKLERCHE